MDSKLNDSYETSSTTMALMACFHEGSAQPYTRVLQTDGEMKVQARPFHIMRENCRDNGSSYKGREEGTKQITNFKKRLPIIVSEALNIYAFPLASVRSPECCWLFPDHLLEVRPVGKGESFIVFKNGMQLQIPVSHGVVDNGYKRASHFRYCFAKRIAEKKALYYSGHRYLMV